MNFTSMNAASGPEDVPKGHHYAILVFMSKTQETYQYTYTHDRDVWVKEIEHIENSGDAPYFAIEVVGKAQVSNRFIVDVGEPKSEREFMEEFNAGYAEPECVRPGFVIKNNVGEYINEFGMVLNTMPKSVSLAHAHRILSDYLYENDPSSEEEEFYVVIDSIKGS